MISAGLKYSAPLSWFLSAHEIHGLKIHSPCCPQGRIVVTALWVPFPFLTPFAIRSSFPCKPSNSSVSVGWGEKALHAAVSLVLPACPITGLKRSSCILARLLPCFALPAASTSFPQEKTQGPCFGCPLCQSISSVKSVSTLHHTHISSKESMSMRYAVSRSCFQTWDHRW